MQPGFCLHFQSWKFFILIASMIRHFYSGFPTLYQFSFAGCYLTLVLMLGGFPVFLFGIFILQFTLSSVIFAVLLLSFKTLSSESITLVQTSLLYYYSFNNFLCARHCSKVPASSELKFHRRHSR